MTEEMGEKSLTARPPDIMSDDRVFLAWQRSHMANERTFLAWSRTSISLLAFGFVIERFDIFLQHLLRLEGQVCESSPHPGMIKLSFLCFVLAGLTIIVSGLRFLRVRRHINKGEAVFSVMPDFLVIVSVVAIIVMAILLSLPRLLEVGQSLF
ncbi:MAG: YidH family protein [Desulfomonilaceae bacterium]